MECLSFQSGRRTPTGIAILKINDRISGSEGGILTTKLVCTNCKRKKKRCDKRLASCSLCTRYSTWKSTWLFDSVRPDDRSPRACGCCLYSVHIFKLYLLVSIF
ncbi:hypothetical protein NA56DRAFT_436218 [Hyaloscypha hepaticicola]|uniref:Zn(2)-C6 fungal-type domain-containing protein n=1 Tax=Hyaloscypha hepaticicola TaxID=2082293 RepID=A0A2J6QGV3_9HELO|nr:hypothetical protein NA56DRAFT_436218 [Hyaloscypha hepaticicola]